MNDLRITSLSCQMLKSSDLEDVVVFPVFVLGCVFRVKAQLSKSTCSWCQGLTPASLMTWSWLSNLGCVSTEENVNSLPAYPGRGATLPAPKGLWKCDHNIALWFPLKTPPIYSAFGMISSEPLSGRMLNSPLFLRYSRSLGPVFNDTFRLNQKLGHRKSFCHKKTVPKRLRT